MNYRPPVEQMSFVLEHVAGLERVRALAPYAHATIDVVAAVLDSAARFASEVLAPLNASGDREGSKLTAQGVKTPDGFSAAYARFRADGWPTLAAPAEYGGQGFPTLVHAAVSEIWSAANHAFSMCPEVAVAGARALMHHAAPDLRDRLLPRIVSGEWACTMCLSEPQAGSDLSQVATSAESAGESWQLRGRKIYASWGEHDLTANIVHFILARIADAPTGVKGLSLFAVPRRLIDADGNSGSDNDVRAISLERKMGIHASPTCVLAIGENSGARGWLIGAENRGLACMFTIMNHMRLGVGLQSVGIADHACQIAAAYARERVQGRGGDGQAALIIDHADVRRMLLTMRALCEGGRALCYTVAALLDLAEFSTDDEIRAAAQIRADLLTPVVKAWCSDMAIEVTSLGIQVLGGAGYLEDTLAAQLYRDVRITAIYEGTNGIQAQDLLGRKVLRDNGEALQQLITDARRAADAVDTRVLACAPLGRRLLDALSDLERATRFVRKRAGTDRFVAGAVAVDYLKLVGYVCVGWQWALSVLAAARIEDAAVGSAAVCDRARFFATHLLPRASLHADLVRNGAEAVRSAGRDRI
jgi:alkylation response protein AidB-like acyl-CoA dehydrogenase